jgi:alpha-beta hydrolase superfamily lysophospholipase
MRPPRTVRLFRNILFLVLGVAIGLLGLRVWQTQRGPELRVWHTFVPYDLHAAQINGIDWTGYLAAESALFEAVRRNVSDRLQPEERTPLNRYFEGSSIYPAHFQQDWNRSYVLEPQGPPRGAAVLLHGLTDAPYSLRHLARYYRSRDFVAVGVRLPGHGTVPASLTDVVWEDWMAATHLAVREARRRVPEGPLHVVGFSNGGALAMKHAMESLDDPRLNRPDQVVLISPMVGVTEFARFAGLAGLPSVLPTFAKAAWLAIVAEFNPFKYNSFPVNGARQSWRLTQALQEQLEWRAREGRLDRLPPVLTFQSVLDFTVSTPAVINALYTPLPANGSELVLFDINRNSKLGIFFSSASETALERVLPPASRHYRTVVIQNASPYGNAMVARVTEPGSVETRELPLRAVWPASVYSLSHVALPFPQGDSLYGMEPDPADESFGVQLGTIAPRGERAALRVPLDALIRMSSNPFFEEMMVRVEQTISP